MASAPPPGDSPAAAEPNPLSQAVEAITAAEQDSDFPSRQPTGNGPSPAAPTGSATGAHRNTSSKDPMGAQDSQPLPDLIPEDPPPTYSETLGNISDDGELGTKATIADDGRVNIHIDQKNRRLSQLLVPALRSQVDVVAREPDLPAPYIPPSLGGDPGKEPPPPLNIVIHVVGSRGDVQPFVALGKVLKETYHHRVRLASHPTFKKFVEENGLEFFSIGGDPAELMAFMVKNPGLMPGFDTLRNGDVGKRRKGIAEIIEGCWRSCIESEDGFGVDSDQRTEAWVNSPNYSPDIPANTTGRPFVADAIIANPPSFAHVHCAEKLGIPLHMMFTHRPREYEPDNGPWDPVTGVLSPVMGTVTTMMMGVADLPIETLKALRIHPDMRKKTNSNPTGSSSGGASSSALNRTDSSGPLTPGTSESGRTDTEHTSFSVESALQSGKGVSRIVGAGMKVPMDVMLGLQRGFHNTSKLYGEEPRQVEKVTGFSSGVKVAGKEFGIGLFEGISGLVTQPLKGAKEEGAGGFIKGFGKGIAGIALKPQAGIYMGIRKPFGATIQNYIIAARTAQGWEEYNKSTAQERALIVELYQIIASSVKKKRNPGEKEMEAIQALVTKRRANAGDPRQNLQNFLGWRSSGGGSSGAASSQPASSPAVPPRSPNTYAPQSSAVGQSSSSPSPAYSSQREPQYEPATLERAENSDLEEAIRLSLAEVSRGNPEEDALMERAMRNSIRETQAANPYMHEQCSVEEEARILHSVMEQSKLDVAEELNRDRGIRGGGGTDTDELEEALRRSRLDAGAKAVARAQQRVNTGSSWGSDSGLASPATVGEVDTGTLASHRSTALGELESMRTGGTAATTTTQQQRPVPDPPVATGRQEDGVMGAQEEEDEELRKALEASERDMRGREDAEEKARREEEIVMEYVKKQSLAEEEHRKRMLGTGGGGSRA
ncbi:hypothetical protein SLS55_000449 [Diplodia seriata]|uniref:Glycosyltransferase family 28 N-terminal domain-containing protein n=1 Tax=Diplodia seriata TaxID=420778 RepID=A0ABR3CVD1_9PEZI